MRFSYTAPTTSGTRPTDTGTIAVAVGGESRPAGRSHARGIVGFDVHDWHNGHLHRQLAFVDNGANAEPPPPGSRPTSPRAPGSTRRHDPQARRHLSGRRRKFVGG
ncbi:hypothetical protein [Actinopolymorpha pittospori]|uniref:hypothetical protein n=1 Tax=Actinopolymorpha pittospori TaxID=648752 RepID=UPI001EE1E94D|nr:hypothetical protein [Actinopolymorpha pittospori]